MEDLYYEKYLKYKEKYLKLKNMIGGTVNEKLVQDMINSGKYSSVELSKEEKNTLYVTLLDDRKIKIVANNYPYEPPLISYGNKYISKNILDYSSNYTLEDYLDMFDQYPLIDFDTIPQSVYAEIMSNTPFQNNKYIEIRENNNTLKGTKTFYVNLEHPIITSGNVLFDIIKNICLDLGRVFKYLVVLGKKYSNFSDEDLDGFRKLRSNIVLNVDSNKILSVFGFTGILYGHTYISKISEDKPVATNHSGHESMQFYLSWNMYSQEQKDMVCQMMSEYFTDKLDYEIKFRIKAYEIPEGMTGNQMLYYSEDHLNILKDRFRHKNLDVSLEILAFYKEDTSENDMDFIHIAFGDNISLLSNDGKLKYNAYKQNAKRLANPRR